MVKLTRLLFSRLALTAILILIQAFLIFYPMMRLTTYSYLFHFFFVICSILLVIYIINKNEEPSFKLPWIILILVFPAFGALFYLMFGDNKMRKKVKKMAKSISKNILSIHEEGAYANQKIKQEFKQFDPSSYSQSEYITKVTGMPFYENTTSEYLEIGETFYERLLEKLKEAKHFIFLEFFILQEGKMLDTVVSILAEKVKQGVDVRFMYDDLGSIYVLPTSYPKKLEALGIKCTVFNPFVPILSIGHNNRDHRKIVVIDGYIGFTGGINLADEYINEYEKHGHWKDTGIMLEGEAVKSLTLMFLESWNYYQKEDQDFSQFMPYVHHPEDFLSDGLIQPFGDTPLDHESVGETVYLNMIHHATNYIYINTPYLIVDYTLLNALQVAAKRGVDVRITTPHVPDKWYVHIMTQSYYHSLIRAGVKIYEYTPGFMHAKSFVCDDKIGIVGTINLDYRSFYHHFECGIWLYQTASLTSIKSDYLSTIEKSMEITEDFCKHIPWYKRLMRELLRFVAPLL